MVHFHDGFLGHFRARPAPGPRRRPRAARPGSTEALREAVRSGRLAPGTRLPSSRTLAADLGIARNTVADAYAELVAEGWLTARQGSGTRVAERAPPRRPAAGRRAYGVPRPARRPAYGLLPGHPRPRRRFPRAAWLTAARRALTDAPERGLRVRRPARPRRAAHRPRRLPGAGARGVRGPGADRLCAGFVHGLTLLARVLRARGYGTVAVEAYGLDFHRDLLARGRAADRARSPSTRTGPAPAELAAGGGRGAADPGAPVPDRRPRCTPDRRAAAVDWARRHGRADPGGRLRRGVPLRPPAGRRAAGAGPGPGGVPGHGEQVASRPGCGWAGWCCRRACWTRSLAAKGAIDWSLRARWTS